MVSGNTTLLIIHSNLNLLQKQTLTDLVGLSISLAGNKHTSNGMILLAEIKI